MRAFLVVLLLVSQVWAGQAYVSSVTINPGQVPSPQTDFPVLVSQTDARFKTVANGGYVNNSNGFDLRPYSDSTATTAITGYELVYYNGTTGQFEMWVKRSSVSDGLVTYMGYGDTTLTTDGSSTTTWSNGFYRLSHLKDGTTLSGYDSVLASSYYTLLNGPTATTGQIDGAGLFVGASSQSLSNGSNNNPNSNSVSMSAWINATSWPSAYAGIMLLGPNVGVYIIFDVTSAGKLAVYVSNGTSDTHLDPGTVTMSTGTWYHVAFTYDTTNGIAAYVNGSPSGTAPQNGRTTFACCGFKIGNDASSSGRGFDGKIDEARFNSTARTQDWFTTEYNEGFPATFETLGAQVSLAGAPPAGWFFFIP